MLRNEDHSLTLRITLPKSANEKHVSLCLEGLGVHAERIVERDDFVLALMPDHATLEHVWNAGRDGHIVLRPGKSSSKIRAMDWDIEKGLRDRRRSRIQTHVSVLKAKAPERQRNKDEVTLLVFCPPSGSSKEDISATFKAMDLPPRSIRFNSKRTTVYVEFCNGDELEKAWTLGRQRQIIVNDCTLMARASDETIQAQLDHCYNTQKQKLP